MKYANISVFGVNDNIIGTLNMSWIRDEVYIGNTVKINSLPTSGNIIACGGYIKAEDVQQALNKK